MQLCSSKVLRPLSDRIILRQDCRPVNFDGDREVKRRLRQESEGAGVDGKELNERHDSGFSFVWATWPLSLQHELPHEALLVTPSQPEYEVARPDAHMSHSLFSTSKDHPT